MCSQRRSARRHDIGIAPVRRPDAAAIPHLEMRYYALIPAAGNGSRFRGDSPKQYWMLDGKPVLVHSIERLAAAIPLQQIHVAVAPGDRWFDEVIGERPGVTVLRCGGATRGETVCNLLSALVGAGDDDWILIHDAVRPCIDAASLMRLQQELLHDAVGGLLALPDGRDVEACRRGRAQCQVRAARGTVVRADAADVPVPCVARRAHPSRSGQLHR